MCIAERADISVGGREGRGRFTQDNRADQTEQFYLAEAAAAVQ